MKKFLAALLAVVMVVSVASFAFAAEVDCYDMVKYNSDARAGVALKGLTDGDIVTFCVKPVAGEVISVENTKIYVRGVTNSTKAVRTDAEGNVLKNEEDEDVLAYGIYFGEENDALWSNADGWYYISAMIKETGDNYISVVTYDPGEEQEKQNAVGATVGACQIADIKVNGESVDAVYSFAGSVGDALTATSIEAPVADTVVGGEEETEDVTEGVEETGVVSVAVVAVAAVVGGAVVLKKREF